MPDDDEAARKSRADDLRKRIDSLKHEQSGGAETNAAPREESEPSDGGKGVSPRDFINEKMRELDR
jgi:hypothetical protein